MTSDVQEFQVKSPGLSRQAQLFLKLAMLFLPPLMCLLGLNGVAYIWEKQQAQGKFAWELVASRRVELNEYTSPGAGYTLMIPGERYEYQGIPVEINSQGLRSPEVSSQKPDGVYRILNLGDSIAMGWGVREQETYGQLLPGYFSNENPRSVEVINAGVPGWNLENELSYLQSEGMKYSPDAVILDLTIVNDIFGNSALLDKGPALIELLRSRTYVWPFLAIQKDWIVARFHGKQRIDAINPGHDPALYFPGDKENPKWDQIIGLINDIHLEAEKAGIPLLVILFPMEDQVIDPAFSTLPQQMLTTKMDQLGIRYIDLLPAYQQACSLKPGGACVQEDHYLFADTWMHPSPRGHQIAAKQIFEVLQDIVR